jgi:hypothetical protein
MQRNVLLASGLALALVTAGCENQTPEPAAPSENSPSLQQLGRKDLTDLALKKVLVRVPVEGRLSDHFSRNLAGRLIDPTDYVCQINSPLFNWADAEWNESLANDLPELIELILEFAADQVPFVEALLVMDESYPDAQEFGYDGDFTNVMLRTERDVKRFWDIPSDDILLLAMKGTMLQDEARVAVVFQNFFVDGDGSAITPAEAAEYAARVHELILQAETLDGGDDPLFSLNAFAFSAPGIQDRIVMGDGVLEGYGAIGFGDVAPQAIYAHEFAHHIQFENEYFSEVPPTYPGGPAPTTQAEFTRYTELMADAMAAYYLTHARGAALNKHRVAKFLSAFFQIGDCAFTNPGHHGTPLQRMRAAEFGFAIADQAQKQGHILTSEQFHDLFVDAYPELIAPDA